MRGLSKTGGGPWKKTGRQRNFKWGGRVEILLIKQGKIQKTKRKRTNQLHQKIERVGQLIGLGANSIRYVQKKKDKKGASRGKGKRKNGGAGEDKGGENQKLEARHVLRFLNRCPAGGRKKENRVFRGKKNGDKKT